MAQSRLSESQVLNVFEVLGLHGEDEGKPTNPYPPTAPPNLPRRLYTSRLSDSSLPPPTGVITDAKLEDATK
jgi:hypothetical protein